MTRSSSPEQWQRSLLQDLRDLSDQLELDGQDGLFDDTANSFRGLRSLFKDQLSAGGGESFSAEEHRGREVLELFQNASDKCRGRDNDCTGAVYIALTEHGILVANTGENFDFSEDDTRDALSIFGYTDKAQDEVGKFGVGLTAVRATGEAYEVWTKEHPNAKCPASQECWRVRCGPENILAPIAQAFKQTADTDPIVNFRDDLEAVAGTDSLLPDPKKTPEGITFDLDADEFPYFLRPLPLRNWRDHTRSKTEPNRLERRGEQLLTGTWTDDGTPDIPSPARSALAASDVESFTTAVFVEYENDTWRHLFTELRGDEPSDRADPNALHEQAWYDGRDSSKITPELLLTLGEAETVVVESWLTDADGSEVQVWNVEPPAQTERTSRVSVDSSATLADSNPSSDDDAANDDRKQQTVGIDLTEVQADLTSTADEPYEFWHVTFTAGRTFDTVPWFEDSGDDSDLPGTTIDAQLLIPKRGSEHTYRPHLYYPISGLDAAFGACLHAEFAVQQDRQSLDGNATMQNACVAAELARLIGCAAEALSRCDDVDDWLAARMPWRLLPPRIESEQRPDELATDGTTADEVVLSSLYTASAARLRKARVTPTMADSQRLAAVTDRIALPDDPDLLAGLVALYEIDATIDGGEHLADLVTELNIDLLAPGAMAAFTAWANDAEGRARAATTEEPAPHPDPASITNGEEDRLDRLQWFLSSTPDRLTTDEWQFFLMEWSDRHRTAVDSSEKTAIETRAPTATTLLNATMAIATPDDESAPDTSTLNTFVPREGPGPFLLPCSASPSSDRGAETSVLLVCLEDHTGTNQSRREVLRPDESSDVDLTPAAATAFNTYQLTQEIAESMQAIKNADWGTTDIEGQLSLFRSFLKAATYSTDAVAERELNLLARHYNEIENPPETRPGAYHSRELVEAIVTANGASEFDERYKTRLEARRTVLSSSLLAEEHDTVGRDVRPSDGCIEVHPNLAAKLTGTTVVDGTPRTADDLASLSEFDPAVAIQTLSMLGVSLLPGIETIALYRDIGLRSDEWNPLTTDSWGDPNHKDRVDNLKTALRDNDLAPGFASKESIYCDLVVAPGFNPSTSIRHTPNCSVKTYLQESDPQLSKYGVMLATWVWMRPNHLAELRLGDLISLLEHTGDDLAETVFKTGWSCNYGKGSANELRQPIPTLLSWQLRCLPGWGDVGGVTFLPPRQPEESTASGWGKPDAGWSLTYAVQDNQGSENAGLRGIEFLPRVSIAEADDTVLSPTTLEGLGVKPIEDLTAAEAALRLQAVLRNNAALQDDEAAVLFGGEIPQGWKTLCEQLLEPIFDTYQETSRGVTELFPYLSHVPVRGQLRGSEAWFALPITSLSESAVYYETLPNVWETRVQELGGDGTDTEGVREYLLEGAPAGTILDGFTDFATAHNLERKERTYPEVPQELATTNPEDVRDRLYQFDYKANILAAAPGRQAKQYRTYEQRYDNAIRALRAVESTEDDAFEDRQWAYQPVDDGNGIKVEDVSSGRVRPVIASKIDENCLPEIAGLFEAIFGGGRSDSYKLALTGQDVDRVDEARQHLASHQHVTLVDDLRRVTALLNVDVDVDVNEHDPSAYRDLRQRCVEALGPKTTPSWDATLDHEFRVLITEIVEQTDAAAYTRQFAAKWLSNKETPADTVRVILADPPGDPSTGWKTAFLRRITNWGDLEEYLPQNRSRVSRLGGVLAAIRKEPTVDDVPEPESIRWSDTVTLDIEGETPDPLSALAYVPDTWFELAWAAADREAEVVTTDVVDSPLYDALETALARHIAGDDEERDAVRTTLRETITGHRQSTADQSTTSDAEIYERLDGTMTIADAPSGLSALDDSTSIRASRRSEKPGTLSDSTTNAPRAAELLVIKSVVEDVVDTDLTPATVETAVETIQNDPYQWHYSSTWDGLPDLPAGSFRSLDKVARPDVSYLHVLCNMADEPIVGFDAMDLTGGLVPEDASELAAAGAATVHCDAYPAGVNPVPVEIKCVGDVTQPRFRFTTNQARRALQFVSSDQGPQRPFLLQFVELSETESGYAYENGAAKVLARPADVYDLLGLEIDGEGDTVETLLTELVRSGHFQIG